MWSQEPQRSLEEELRTQRDHCRSYRRRSHRLGLAFGSRSFAVAATAAAGAAAMAAGILGSHRRPFLSRSGSSGSSRCLKLDPVALTKIRE